LPEKTEGRSKEARAVAISHLFESGKVFFPRNEDFVNVLVDELVSFPASKRKDQVDSVSQALRFMKRQEDAWVEWL
jgi:predicted phage terminase large subunit-like protein